MDDELDQFSFMDFDLFEVARNGCFTVLNIALENLEIYNFDVNSQDQNGNSLMHYTAKNGNVESTTKLLSFNAFVNILNEKGESPLHAACSAGNLHVARILVEKGAKINALDYFRETPLFKSVRSGNKAVSKFLISKGANTRHTNKIGENLLHMAAKFGDKYLTQMLLDEGEDPNTLTGYGDSPIILAIRHNFDEIFTKLSSTKADLAIKDLKRNYTLLHLAVLQNLPTICEKLLVSGKIKVDCKDGEGFTPLHLAAERNFTEIMKILIENGANVNETDLDNYTPLHIAASMKRNGDAVEILLRNNAKVDSKTVHGDLPLHRAAASGNEKGVILLFSRKYIKFKNNMGLTPTQIATQHGRRNIAQLLQNFEMADSNDRNNNDTIIISKNKMSTSIPIPVKSKK